jgi:hypothetical protein
MKIEFDSNQADSNPIYFHSRWRIEFHDLLCENEIPPTAQAVKKKSIRLESTLVRPLTSPLTMGKLSICSPGYLLRARRTSALSTRIDSAAK